MKFAALGLICVLLGSCLNDGNCLITATNYMHIQFKKESNSKLDTLVNLTTIFVSGANPDSILKINSATNEILLPVNIHSNATTFIFNYENSSTSDTLQVGYTTQSKIIAKECGAFTYYQNLKILYTKLKVKAFSTSLLTDPTLYVAGSINYQAYAVNYQIFY